MPQNCRSQRSRSVGIFAFGAAKLGRCHAARPEQVAPPEDAHAEPERPDPQDVDEREQERRLRASERIDEAHPGSSDHDDRPQSSPKALGSAPSAAAFG